MRRAPGRAQPDAQRAARREPQPVVGRLAVHEKPRCRWRRDSPRARRRCRVPRRPRTAGRRALALPPQDLGRRDLRRQDALRVARAAAVDPIALEPARKERRHAVEMRGEHDRRAARGRRDDVESGVVDRLLGDRQARARAGTAPASGPLRLAAGRRIDVDQPARQVDQIDAGVASPNPRLELRARVGPRVAVFHDDRRGQRQAPLRALPDRHRARARTRRPHPPE